MFHDTVSNNRARTKTVDMLFKVGAVIGDDGAGGSCAVDAHGIVVSMSPSVAWLSLAVFVWLIFWVCYRFFMMGRKAHRAVLLFHVRYIYEWTPLYRHDRLHREYLPVSYG
jgi:hypothetical protein